MVKRKYSDKDLIKIIQDKAKELGRTPTRREVKQNNIISQRFGGWNNALKLAGLNINYRIYNNLTKENCIKMINDKAIQLGHTPLVREWNDDKSLPTSDTICKIFDNKNWSEIMQVCGLNSKHTSYGQEENHFFNQFTDKEILSMVKNELKRLNTTNQTVYLLNKSKEIPTLYYLKKRFNLSGWNDLLLVLGYSRSKLRIYEYTKDELIQSLLDYHKETGLNPTINAMCERGYNHATYRKHFGSFNNALVEVGLPINQELATVTHTDEELLQMYKDLCIKLNRSATETDIETYLPYKVNVFAFRFGGLQNLRILIGFDSGKYQPYKYSKEIIKRLLIEQYKKYNRRLTNAEVSQLSKSDDNFPTVTTICRYFRTTKMSEVWEYIEDGL